MKLSAALLLLAAGQTVNALLPIHIKDYRFIKPASPNSTESENEVFYVKGIDYQPGGSSGYDPDSDSDVLSDPEQCARDAFVFQQLGINTIRVYTLNPDINHDKCMTILNNAGIYVILDVNGPHYGENLNRADPVGTYNAWYMSRVFRFIDAFKNYPNVLGFFAGNEIINDESNYAEIDPQFIRAIQRDMKEYIAKHSNRTIPVGYSAADNVDLRLPTLNYLQCNSLTGGNITKTMQESRSDFFGLNTYEWCSGSSDWKSSGFDKLNSSFSDAVIPVIFSEYGCNKNKPRTFDEVSEGLYGGLKAVFSGGLVYEYSEEANEYGLVTIDPEDGSITFKEDFENLKNQLKNSSLPTIKEKDVPKSEIFKCNASLITSEFSDFGVKNFSIPEQSKDTAYVIKWGANGTEGQILKNYTAPTTFKYEIKNVDGSVIPATITYPSSNLINELQTSSTMSVSSTSSASVTSSAKSSSVSSSTKKGNSSKSKASKSTSSGNKKARNGAEMISTPGFGTGFAAAVAAAVAALL